MKTIIDQNFYMIFKILFYFVSIELKSNVLYATIKFSHHNIKM